MVKWPQHDKLCKMITQILRNTLCFTIFPFLVQVPGERGWNSGSVSLSLPNAREQSGSEAGLTVL